MNRVLAAFLFAIIALTARAQAQIRRATGNEVFCQNQADFAEYLAVVNSKQSGDHTVKGCMELKKGMRYRILEEHPENGINKIHLFLRRGAVDGYAFGTANK